MCDKTNVLIIADLLSRGLWSSRASWFHPWLSLSIRNHDQGKKHVEIVAEFFRKKREDKLKGAQSESDLARQMERIEQAALRAHEKDLAMFGGGGSGSTSGLAAPPPPPPPGAPPPPPPGGPPPPPPANDSADLEEHPPPPPPPGAPPRDGQEPGERPPPPPPPGAPPKGGWDRETPPPPPPPGASPTVKKEELLEGRDGQDPGEHPAPPPPPGASPRGGQDRETPPPPPPPGAPPGVKKEELLEGGGAGAAWDGVLQEGDQWYLDGQAHRDKLAVDSACQIFVESEGQWVDAVVLSIEPDAATTTPVAGGTTRRLELAYFEAGAEKETVLSGVEAWSVRLPAGAGGIWPPPLEKEALPPPPPPDENTGLGGWQTVSVRLVDEVAEAEARRKKKEVKKAKKQKREEKTERETMLVEAMDADDAMGSYDPWGTGKYKGFEIAKDVPRGPEEDTGGGEGGGASSAASFKKRKGPGNKGKFRKKPRDDDD
eukprot:jgi/Undpi1/7373/HiC_scaffold_22.g09846.m1